MPGADAFPESDNESNEDLNDEIEINTGNINAPADAPYANNNTSMLNESPITYH